MKEIILWNYERGTWQYDLFCLLIIAFIFLTPKTWFDNGEKIATPKRIAVVKVKYFSFDNAFVKNRFNINQTEITESAKRRISPRSR